jgi:hypothetical protein
MSGQSGPPGGPAPNPAPNKPDPKAIAQGVKDLTSDFANALKLLGVQNTQIISAVGGIIATMADFSVGNFVGAVVTFVGAIVSLFDTKSGPDEIQQLGQALDKLITDIYKAEGANSLDTWKQGITDEVSPVQGIQASLKAWADAPPASSVITQALTDIVAKLAALAPPDVSDYRPSYGGYPPSGAYWMRPYNYQVYWDDSDSPDIRWPWPPYSPLAVEQYGYPKQAPTADGNGNVFYHTYILPSFLYVVSVFLAVGAVFDPKFKENWADTVLKPTILFLRSAHDYIISPNHGLTQLAPPPFTAESLTTLLATYVKDAQQAGPFLAGPPLGGAQQGILPSFNWLGPSGIGFITTPGLEIEYGFVDKFSGYNSVGIYTILTNSQDFSFASGPNYYGKFQIRLIKRKKDVYVGTGLSAVWSTINNLNAIVGDPPLPGPSIADWSVRRDLAPFANVTASNGSVSLVAIQNFLLKTPPTDFKEGPLAGSFRAALNV